MKTRLFLSICFLALAALTVYACGPYGGDLVRSALEGNDKERANAIALLRTYGPGGLQMVLDQLAETTGAEDQAKLHAIADQVARQTEAWESGLYWHTDLSRATARAQAEKKPILSLRLLGDLDDEFC
jgi:hypothetical protein